MPESLETRPGILASIAQVFRENRVPCLLLNVLVASLVGSYYFLPAVAGAWEALAVFKQHWGFAFAFVSTVFSAVLLPSALQWMMGTLPVKERLKRIVCLSLFWGWRGIEVDFFYRFQGHFFGTGNDAFTLAKKLVMDQFVYTTIWAAPTYLVVLLWIDVDYSWPRLRATLDRRFWTHTYPSVIVTNWLVWVPAVLLIYSLPGALQFPLFAVVMCFFVLIVTLLTRSGEPTVSKPLQA